MNQQFQKQIQENLKRVENGEELNVPLAILNGEFKEAYFHPNKFIPKKLNCIICGKIFKQKFYNQITCSKKCGKDKLKAYREKNKDKIAKTHKAYYEKNKDKLKAYREKNKWKKGEKKQ